MRTTTQNGTIRITRTIDLPVRMWDEPSTLHADEGDVFNGPLTVTASGNALIGLAYDDPVIVPRGAFEVVS